MPKFALKFPFFIIMLCLLVSLVGVVTVPRMPVDLFPEIDMPVVVVATFLQRHAAGANRSRHYQHFRALFTLAANVDHSESRSLTGVSLIKIYFKPGTDAKRGPEQHRQPGHGRPAPPAAGNSAPCCAGHGLPPLSRYAW